MKKSNSPVGTINVQSNSVKLLRNLEFIIDYLSSHLRSKSTEVLIMNRHYDSEIEYFLQSFYLRNKQFYLLDVNQIKFEKKIKAAQRSTHICALRDGKIIGILRMTPFPFEMSFVNCDILNYSIDYNRYVEYSRLVTNKKYCDSDCVQLMMAHAAHWGIKHKYGGVVALTKKLQKRFYTNRLGLRAVHEKPFCIDEREFGEYWMMKANWLEIYNSKVWTNLKTEITSENKFGDTDI
jgi:hypothetical protein